MTKYGVIDLGTNTFHLLIVRQNGLGHFEEVYRERIFVKLAEEGIGKIGLAAFDRAVAAIKHYSQILEEKQVKKVRAFGTAALRTASNSEKLVKKIKAETGITVQIIPGEEEARLIHMGVSLAVSLEMEKALIMDIGGGSVEFILANENEVFWSGSFPIGVAVLFNKFHRNDPISVDEIQDINVELSAQLATFLQVLKIHPPTQLIGASGTFDVLENMLRREKTTAHSSQINPLDFYPFYDQLVQSSLSKRLNLPGLPNSRAELIVVALVLIRFILKQIPVTVIKVSSYSMKEGIIQMMIGEEEL